MFCDDEKQQTTGNTKSFNHESFPRLNNIKVECPVGYCDSKLAAGLCCNYNACNITCDCCTCGVHGKIQ